MNRLSKTRRTAILKALIEGNSIRATCRLTGCAKGTVLKLLPEVGRLCADLHDEMVRNVAAKRVQCDEIWSFVGAKAKNVRPERRGAAGDLWTWVALDADSKLAISYLVGDRGMEAAEAFLEDLRDRVANRIQLTTDGHSVYLNAVGRAFDYDGIDYAMLIKSYSNDFAPNATRRYSPPVCTGATKTWVLGKPVYEDVSTSYVERQNLTLRMQSRRFTRLTNAFSKKAENHAHAVALHFFAYNFCRVHQTLTKKNGGVYMTPAMAAGITDRVWRVEDLVDLLVEREGRDSVAES